MAFNQNLQKPSPMPLHYNTNGTGRDSYIYMDNGGFSLPDFGQPMGSPGTMKPDLPYRPPYPHKLKPIQSRPIHYVQDGQGRDSYILSSHGGFVNPSYSPSGTFFSRLRCYERSENRYMTRSPSAASRGSSPTNSPSRGGEEYGDLARPDIFQRSQAMITNKKSLASLRKTSKEQKILTNKLSQPKPRKWRENAMQKYSSMLALNDEDSFDDREYAVKNRNPSGKFGGLGMNAIDQVSREDMIKKSKSALGQYGDMKGPSQSMSFNDFYNRKIHRNFPDSRSLKKLIEEKDSRFKS